MRTTPLATKRSRDRPISLATSHDRRRRDGHIDGHETNALAAEQRPGRVKQCCRIGPGAPHAGGPIDRPTVRQADEIAITWRYGNAPPPLGSFGDKRDAARRSFGQGRIDA
jgi:hypothetical protein